MESPAAVSRERGGVEVAEGLDPHVGVHRHQFVANGEPVDSDAFVHVGMQERIKPLQVFARANLHAEEGHVRRVHIEIRHGVVVLQVEHTHVFFVVGTGHGTGHGMGHGMGHGRGLR